jgi:uncharacterized repeat protein (TIGR01451 family)
VSLTVSAALASGLSAAAAPATGAAPGAGATGDFNGDGKTDLVTANSTANTVSVLLGNGDGTFRAKVDYNVGTQPVSVAVGDFNGDGKTDIAVANQSAKTVSVLLGNGDGTFQAGTSISTGTDIPTNVQTVDWNQDGKVDLLVVSSYTGGNGSSCSCLGSGNVFVFYGNGDGTFYRSSTNLSGTANYALMADSNGDGNLDLLVMTYAGVYFYQGAGGGTLGSGYSYTSGSYSPSMMAAGDLNGDGILDVVTTDSTGAVDVFIGNGDGSFRNYVKYAAGTSPLQVAIGDINGDGKLDVVSANSGSNTISVLFGTGDGRLLAQETYPTGSSPYWVASGDWNGDSRTDLAIANNSGNSVSIYLGVLTPVLSVSSTHIGNFNFGTTGTYTLTVSNLGPGVTAGTVTLVDTLPSGLTAAASMGGTGWSCNSATQTCTRSDALAAGASYAPVTLVVNAALGAVSPAVNMVSVSGGGAVSGSGSDSTIINSGPPYPALIAPANQATGIPVDATLSWSASAGATSYDVYLGTTNPPPFVVSVTGTSYSAALSAGQTYYWQVAAKNSGGSNPSAIWSFTSQVIGLYFYPVAPCRLVDTRGTAAGFNGIQPFSGPSIASGATLTIPVQSAIEAGTNTTPAPCGTIPSAAQAYSLNITVVPHSGGAVDYVSLWPSGSSQPFVSTLDDPEGLIVANAAIVPAGSPSGGISVYNAGPSAADVIIDMNGYFAPATSLQFYPMAPCRLADTRGLAAGFNGIAPFAGPSITAGQTLTIPVQLPAEAGDDTEPAPCGVIPSTAQAYSLNLTVVPHAEGAVDYVTLWPSGSTKPFVSTLNDPEGLIVANAAVVPAGSPSGGISVYNAGPSTTDVVIDMNGYFAPPATSLQFYSIAPCRLVDTRGAAAGFNGIAPFSGPSIAAGGTLTIPVQSAAEASANTAPAPCGTIPSTAQAYSINVTVVPHEGGAVDYVSLWPSGSAQPFVSTLNDPEGLIVANAAIVPAGASSGGVSLFNAGPSIADVIIDMNGYFAP